MVGYWFAVVSQTENLTHPSIEHLTDHHIFGAPFFPGTTHLKNETFE